MGTRPAKISAFRRVLSLPVTTHSIPLQLGVFVCCSDCAAILVEPIPAPICARPPMDALLMPEPIELGMEELVDVAPDCEAWVDKSMLTRAAGFWS